MFVQLSPGIDLGKALGQLDNPAQQDDDTHKSLQTSNPVTWTAALDGELETSSWDECHGKSIFWGKSSAFGLLRLVTDAKNIVAWPHTTQPGSKKRPEFWDIPCVWYFSDLVDKILTRS